MTIRDATSADLPAIVAIYNAAIPGRTATGDLEPISVESRHGWFNEHSSSKRPLWVVEREDEIRGWLSFQSFIGRPAYHATAEISIYVNPRWQGNGYGRRLLTEAIGKAPGLGLRTLVAFIFGHNDASLGLFRGFGFETWARLPAVAELDRVDRDLLILGFKIAPDVR